MVAHDEQVPASATAENGQRHGNLPASVYQSLFEHAGTAMVIHDLDGWLLDANQAYAELLGYRLDEVIGLHSSDVLHPDDRIQRDIEAEQMFTGHLTGVTVHRRHIRKDGSVIDARVRKTVMTHPVAGTVVLVVVDRWDVVGELQYWASHDELTGLLNRRGIRERIALVYPVAPTWLAMVDVDGLKAVNDRYGHAIGDRLLGAVAEALTECAPEGSIVGRWAGDEFVVCTPIGELHAAENLTAILLGAFRDVGVTTEDAAIDATVSVGVTRFEPGAESLDAALTRSDSGMYGQKRRRGRARPE